MVDGFARSVGRAAAGVKTAARTVLPVDSNPVPGEWRHVTKVDPEDEKRLPLLYPLYLRHTDAVSVGGSSDVTPRNTEETFDLLRFVPTPAFHEPSAPEHVTEETRDAASFVAIPEVVNGDVEAMVGELGRAIEHVRDDLAPARVDDRLPWVPRRVRDAVGEFAASWLVETANFEAYVIQNPDSAAARESGVAPEDVLSPQEAARRAMAAERRLGSEVLYVEYSGTYGGEEGRAVLSAVDDAVDWSRVWYGGGIDDREAALSMLSAGADAVVVGDAFHEVAEEEADLCERALADLPLEADRGTIDEWLTDEVTLDETDAASFLSTVPSVPDPTARAREYLAAAVRTRLRIAALARDLGPDASASQVCRRLAREGPPGERALTVLDDHGRAYATAVGLAALGAEVGVDAGSLPVEHVAPCAEPDATPRPG
ncbi:heptaprenylglyceryl phosphate synthase [Halobacteriales archaeon QS_8_69_26]|nr:MAG: heptaprenylglyceryl phosphate synthase [Halobacteriales archaeon QS_8_69_26]